jgi:hypothetical protein
MGWIFVRLSISVSMVGLFRSIQWFDPWPVEYWLCERAETIN